MDHQDEALKELSEENTPDATPATESKPEEVSEPEVEEETEAEEEETEPAEGPKKGENQRIRQLVKEKNEFKGKAQSLAEKLEKLTGSVEPSDSKPYESQVQPGQEISTEQYKQDVAMTADNLVQLRIKQDKTLERINKEANEAIKEYPQLDPTSDSFDEELSDSVTEAVEAHVRANPYTSSVKNFTDKMMKPYKRAVAKEVDEVTENVAKQVSETALRPVNIKKTEGKFEEKSVEEMEEALGVVR